jgi:outer membrane protein assembly factor BamB
MKFGIGVAMGVLCALMSNSFTNIAGASPRLAWSKRVAVDGDVGIDGLAADDDQNLYITGGTSARLGDRYFGGFDAYVAKYDRLGERIWVRQSGLSGIENGRAIAWHGGSVYVAGDWEFREYYVSKYSPDGTLVWNRNPQIAEQSNEVERLAFDSTGNFYVCGGYPDLTKYNAQGQILWTNPISFIRDCAADSMGNLYLGYWAPTVPQSYLSKLTPAGATEWSLPMRPTALTVREDALYVATRDVSPTLNRFDTAGNLIWSVPFPNASNGLRDVLVTDVAVDERGNVYVAGQTTGDDNAEDMVIHKYSPSGDLLWDWYGDGITDGEASARALAIGKNGWLYVGGYVQDMGAPYGQGVLFAMVPEPNAWAMVVTGCAMVATVHWGLKRAGRRSIRSRH